MGPSVPESPYAWFRLAASLAIMTIGAVGMYAMAVALPLIQAEFSASRSAASLPYTLTMLGFGVGGMVMGRLSDRFGTMVPILISASALAAGFSLAALAPSLLLFTLAHGLLIGFLGCSATFAPLIADASHWFVRRRGIAVAICASGNYLGGAIWPPVLNHFFETSGWRATYFGLAGFCFLAMVLLSLALRRPSPRQPAVHAGSPATGPGMLLPLGFTPGVLLGILAVAGVACCVAMSMPQVHIVAYCTDLGYGAARGAEMLSIMLGFGVVSRLVSGWISDRIGGLRTLLLNSALQGIALILFLPFDGLASLYVVAALFGLFQGGIVPSYAIVIREYFPQNVAGAYVGFVIMATMLGMAVGGWMSGAIFDLTGSYTAAFVNGIAWNVLNFAIALWLLRRSGPRPKLAAT